MLHYNHFNEVVVVHAEYMFVSNTLNTNYDGTTFDVMPGSFDSSQILTVCGLECLDLGL